MPFTPNWLQNQQISSTNRAKSLLYCAFLTIYNHGFAAFNHAACSPNGLLANTAFLSSRLYWATPNCAWSGAVIVS
jgi:hypothetical protein